MKADLFHIVAQLIHRKTLQICFSFSVVLVLTFGLFSQAFAGGNDFVDTELRVDLTSVNQARDYRHTIWIGGIPNNGSPIIDFTTAWLGFDLAQYNGQLFSGLFTQVGFKTDKNGPYWFVYSEAGVVCFQGSQDYGNLGCRGDYYSRATIGNWQNVELVTYGQGYWIARVYDQYGNSLDVAKILSNSLTIYNAFVDSEEGYTETTDPYMLASFWHNHPKYMIWGSGFSDWPASSGGHNNWLQTTPASICPNHYIARLNWGGDPRVWYEGSAGLTPVSCSANPIW